MKSGLLLAVILPVAFAVKKTNKVVTPVVSRSYRNNKNHARQVQIPIAYVNYLTQITGNHWLTVIVLTQIKTFSIRN